MNTIAKVEILQKRIAERTIIIEADVEIRGITKRKRYIVDMNSSNDYIRKYISDKIIEEEKTDVIGESFEVEVK